MVCHGCYDAPCQLKLDAWMGLERGASKEKVYDGTRLRTAKLTRLFEDAQTTEQWRAKGFYPVLAEESDSQSVIVELLKLKERHPLPAEHPLPDSFDLGLDRDQQCPKAEEFDQYARDYPLWGMPYALPGLDERRQDALLNWLEQGAAGVPYPALSAAEQQQIDQWEAFFNGETLKQQLMSRYIFEHLFIGDLYFSELPGYDSYFQMVRSRTPPGQPIDIISTRRPYGDPDAERFYYRLIPKRTAVLAKRHMPYALNTARLQRWHELFLEPEYEVKALPSYELGIASNPFIAFESLPLVSRYKFMLDEAQFTIMAYIKGPVCRGQVALNVIDDHFWVVFVDPDVTASEHTAAFLAEEAKNLRLPESNSGLLLSLLDWRKYSKEQLKYLKAKTYFLEARTGKHGNPVNLDLLWDGNGVNDNASLTVFRHFDSASVVKGLVGQQPKTAWVIDYSLLERIHYLLVAGFDVYGNVSHQLETRLYMDFLRMEGEQNFLIFLPKEDRIALRNYWYRGASEHVKQFVMSDTVPFDRDTDIEYSPKRPAKEQLLDMLRAHEYGARAEAYHTDDPSFTKLQSLQQASLQFMPQVAFVNVFDKQGQDRFYSIIHNNGLLNNAQLFKEAERRVPEEDYLTVVKGFIGTYPNVFFHLREQDLPDFVDAIAALKNEQDYSDLVTRYGVRRNAPWFWHLSDQFHAHYVDYNPREAGLFDLNRYQNR